jgi:hypothetical protein
MGEDTLVRASDFWNEAIASMAMNISNDIVPRTICLVYMDIFHRQVALQPASYPRFGCEDCSGDVGAKVSCLQASGAARESKTKFSSANVTLPFVIASPFSMITEMWKG